ETLGRDWMFSLDIIRFSLGVDTVKDKRCEAR
ncbi:MAG: hypothetical protein RL146_646, partial [Actinomycetota bacterium]